MSFREHPATPETPTEPVASDARTAAGEPAPVEPNAGPTAAGATGEDTASRPAARNMLPQRERRRFGVERLLVRLVATCGIVAIGVAIAAIMVSSKAQGWVTGLVVALVSVILSAILWSSRQV
jgi:hypothetical protein